MSETKYYPEIYQTQGGTHTVVRKKHRGKWYDIHVTETGVDAEKRIHAAVYKVILFYKVDLNIAYTDGTKVHTPSELQISEKQRLLIKKKTCSKIIKNAKP